MKNVLVALRMEQRHKDKLRAAGEGCKFVFTTQAEATLEQVQWADVIIGNVPADKIQASKRLALLQLDSAGTDAYVQPGVLAEGTVLANSTGAYGKAVSEHAFAMTLMLQKKLHTYRDAQRSAKWIDAGMVCSISDCTVVVVGLGDIGLHYARLAKALGAYVIGVKRRVGACPEGVDELCSNDELDKALARADVVASFLPGTGGTYHTYNAERFAVMKPNAVFINCGRGSAVDSAALYDALVHGKIAAAGLDVTEVEPLPEDSPLWSVDNLMITPHISGNFHLPDILEHVVDFACANLRAYLSGGEYINLVDMKTGCKK